MELWKFNDLSEVYHDPWGTPMETRNFTGLFENCCISGEKVTLTKHPWGAKPCAWTCLGTVELGFKSMFNWLQSFFFFFFLSIPQKTMYCLFACFLLQKVLHCHSQVTLLCYTGCKISTFIFQRSKGRKQMNIKKKKKILKTKIFLVYTICPLQDSETLLIF